MAAWAIMAAQALVSAAPGDRVPVARSDGARFDLAATLPPPDARTAATCRERAAPDAIVICGTRRDRYRLPLPAGPTPRARDRPDAASEMAALTAAGRCGIFAGERRCGKREAAEYGYGDGRDPLTLAARLASRLADRDGD